MFGLVMKGFSTQGYPATRRLDLVEEVHGVPVQDPYRWLEDIESQEAQAWIAAQNAYTRGILDALEGRDKISARLSELASIGYTRVPQVRGDRYFYQQRSGTQNQAVVKVREGVNGPDRVLIDPNTLSQEGLMALDWWAPSADGRLLAYGLSRQGDEWSTVYIRNVDTGEDLGEAIPRTRYCSLAWLPDNSGFYYTPYPLPGSVPPGEENYNSHLFFHRIGEDWRNDPKVFGAGRRPEDMINVKVSADGRYLLLTVFQGWSRSEIFLCDLWEAPGRFIPIVKEVDALFYASVRRGYLYILTNLGAPDYHLYRTPLGRLQQETWELIIPEGQGVLRGFSLVGDRLFVSRLNNAYSCLTVHTLSGRLLGQVPLPGPGTASIPHEERDGLELFFSFTSFFTPTTVYRYDIGTGDLSIFDRVGADIDEARYEVKQAHYTSNDGARVSMFIIHQRGLRLDGDNPTILTGYGGFNISLTPEFQRMNLFWLEKGGVIAIPNLRGGGEYGERWHQAGMLGAKQQVFDDFIAAAEWLIERRYTNPSRLAISGASNGGLLMGAALTQRPDLFKAVHCGVPLLDMLRYHQFYLGRLWVSEYGCADDPEQFKWLYSYSPYHRVRSAEKYPAVLITTAEHDHRVHPMHALKMAALQQHESSSGYPILLWVEPRAGHGAGKPVKKVVAE